MKKVYSIFLSFCFIVLFSSQAAANKDGTILLTARLSPSQEVPAITNTPKAKGLVTIILEEDRSLTINGVFDSLSGPVTACHFHKAVFGVAGGVVLNLLPYVKGNRIYGKIANPGKAFITQLMSDSLYVNVHTTLNGGGEIRGQVFTQTDYHLWSIMAGAFEVPAVNTQGIGLASVVLSRTLLKVEYKILATGLSGAITSAHFHYGTSTTANGTIAYPLAFSATSNVLTGSIDVDANFVNKLDAGEVYVNIHTSLNGGGEIRGQLSYTEGIAYDALMEGANEVPAVTTNAKGLAIAWSNEALDTLQYAVLYTGLSAAATAAHFHIGKKGETGANQGLFTAYQLAPSSAFVGRVPWSGDNLNRLLKDSIYVNIHTSLNGGGEIRGQMSSSVREGVVGDLCGKQEVPAVTTAGIGAAYASIDRNKFYGELGVYTNGLSGNATAAHFHKAPKGVAGNVYLNFGATTNNTYVGGFTFTTTTAADSLRDGLMYFNVHTALNGGGEIRGQAGKALTPDCLPTGIFELNGEKLTAKVFPNPTREALNLVFQSNQSFDAQIVISDVIGRSVTVKNFKVIDGENQLPMSVSSLSNGLYFLQLKNNGKIVFSEKIIKE